MTESAAAPQPRTVGLLEDCLEIFYAPGRVFERRRGRGFLAPLAVLVVLMLVLWFAAKDLLQPALDAQIAQGMAQAKAQNPELTDEQLAGMRGMAGTMAMVWLLVGTVVSPLLLGFTLWLVGKGVGARQQLGDAMNVAVFAWFPRLLGVVVMAALALMTPEGAVTGVLSLTIGLGRFLDPATTSPALLALLGRVELFTIWSTVLLAIGLRVTGRATTAQAAVAAVVLWVLGGLPTVLPALASG
jgi:hypothetical protein